MGFEGHSTSVCLCACPLLLPGTAWDPVCMQNTLRYCPINGREGEPGYSSKKRDHGEASVSIYPCKCNAITAALACESSLGGELHTQGFF